MTDLTPVSSLDDVIQHETNTSVLGGPGGPMNAQAQQLLNRTKFLDDKRILLEAFDTDLGDESVASKGAAKVGRAAEGIESIVALLTTPTARARHISVASYHTGWAATVAGPLGRSVWAWDATEPKANHNGFDKVSPTVPWTGAFATMDAFQAGTGETAPGTNGCWIRIHGANDIVSWGCLPVAGTNNFAALSRAIAWAYTNRRKLTANEGTFEYGTTLDLSYPTLVLHGQGFRNSVLKYTGGGIAADAIGTRPNNGAFSIYIEIADITFEGNLNVSSIMRLRINHAKFTNVNFREAAPTGNGLLIEGVVLGSFINVSCSTGVQLMAARPLRGVVFNVDPTDGRRASANSFHNLIVEGMLENGIHMIAADQTTFMGGTSENNSGIGIFITSGCQINTFIGMGLENSGFADIFDSGQMSRFINCYGNKNIYFDTTSRFARLEGGYFEKIEVTATAEFTEIAGVKVKFFGGTGGIITNNNPTLSIKDVYDVAAGAMVFPKKASSAITVGASPFTYTNNGGRQEAVVVSGGTISSMVYNRDGVVGVAALPTSGKFELLPGDGITIAYTVAPTVTKIPGGTNFM